MEHARPDRASAPYGQACTNCVRAKCRCMRGDGVDCERCSRLGKQCVMAPSLRTKGSRKSAPASKRANLEDRLEDLVDLLRTQQGPVTSATGSSNGSMLTPVSSYQSPFHQSESTTEDLLNDDELWFFRNHHLKHFPFIFLPATLTADQLQSSRPMFCLAIKTICNKAHTLQTRLSKRCRELLAQKLLVEGKKDFDTLLSLTACMAWSYCFTNGKRFLLMFAGLARSLISDLLLERAAWHPLAGPMIELGMGPRVEEQGARSNEVRRILISCFLLSILITTSFKTDNIMSWSRQLEEDCNALRDTPETADDSILVAVGQICKVTARAAEIRRCLADDNEDAGHVALHITSLLTLLNNVRTQLSTSQSQHTIVNACLYSAEISTYELIFLQKSITLSHNPALEYKRVEYLSALLKVSRRCADYFLSLDLTDSTAPTQLVFSHAIKTIHRLSILSDPTWDFGLIAGDIDVPDLFNRCAKAAEDANERLKATLGEDSVFAEAAKDIRDMIPKWLLPGRDRISPRPLSASDWQVGQEHTLSMDIFSEEFWMDQPFNF